MKKSPYESEDYSGNDFDPHMDFSQVLKEARQYASELKSQVSSPYSDREKMKLGEEEKKSKKSWKNSVISWWKFDKKSKPPVELNINCGISNPRRRGCNSGSIIHENSGKAVSTRRVVKRPTSGPVLLTGLFHPARRGGEKEIPYMCLDHQNGGVHVQEYGPLYLVT